MKKLKLSALFIIIIMGLCFSTGCQCWKSKDERYNEIPSMLNTLTNNIQLACEEGYFDDGEAAGLDRFRDEYPNTYNWFVERGYTIRVSCVSDYAVVMICDGKKTLFEDTYCKGGPPDRDYTKDSNCIPCEITMTPEEVETICE